MGSADHWEPKDHKGPSDDRAAGGRDTDEETAEGVDARASQKHLYEIAQRLDVPGRSTMDKDELVEAIKKANRPEGDRALEDVTSSLPRLRPTVAPCD